MNNRVPCCDQPHVASEAGTSCSCLRLADTSSLESSFLSKVPSTQSLSPSHPDFDMYPLSINTDCGFNNVDHISKLELSFCSYFECCNIQLPDFHAFVDHCEEEHISRSRSVPFYKGLKTPNGAERKSAPVQPSLPPSSNTSRASSVLSSPTTPTSPLSPLLVGDDFGRQCKPLSHNLAYTPFNPAISFDVDQVYPELADDVPSLFHYDYDYDFGYEYYSRGTSSPPFSDDSDGSDPAYYVPYGDEMSPPPTPVTPTSPVYTLKKTLKAGRTDGSVRFKFPQPHNVKRTEGLSSADTPRAFESAGASAGKGLKLKSRSSSGHGHGKSSKRERAFRCPNAGCTKTYLNPNGLKYHLEKGTCKIEDDNTSDVVDVVSTAATENTRGTSAERVTCSSFESAYPQQLRFQQPAPIAIQGFGTHVPQVSQDGQQNVASVSPSPGNFRGYFGPGRPIAIAREPQRGLNSVSTAGAVSPLHHTASPVVGLSPSGYYEQHASDVATHMTG